MRYRILGATTAHDEQGAPVPVGGPRVRALLAALALQAGRTVPVESLIDEVWAGDPPHDAPAALQALVGRLRRALGRQAVASAPGGYRLGADPDDVDLHRFERLTRHGTEALHAGDPATASRVLREALALWHGPALADLPDRTAAARPESRRLDATRTRIEADLRLGRAHDLVPELHELTETHPYDEPLHAQLIRALRGTGRGADALAAYERARRTLAEGLGTDPGPELRSLYRELLAAEGAPQGGVEERSRAPQGTGSAGSDGGSGSGGSGGNLRPRLTSFVGREPELAAIRSDLQRARLVTLTGPGGSGKTRLAEEAAAGHPAPAWLAELAPLEHPEAVPGAVVSALGLRETVLMTSELAPAHDDPTGLLVEYCAPRGLLLILDNCEHLVDATARLAETLLTRCPELRILATSREPLGVPGEAVRPVDPLPGETAHRLFAERAAAVRPGFDPAQDPESVAEICARLDGLPLAIELAAARLRLLTPRQIADRLDDRFRLLTSGSRTVLPRQQTLRAVVDWSWDLLDERERRVLREVSVFAGGWDLPAAEAVCGPDAADLIGALVDKSLVVAAPAGRAPGMRYRLLETIHEYALERAAEAAQNRSHARERHTRHFLELVREAEPLLRTEAQLPWIHRLESELDNIRAALHRTIDAGDETRATEIALAMGWFWWLRNYRKEGAEWTTRILALATEGPDTEGLDTEGLDTEGPDTEGPNAENPAPESPDPESDPRYWPRMRMRLGRLFLVTESGLKEELRTPEARAEVLRLRDAFARPIPQSASFPGLLWPFLQFVLDDHSDRNATMDLVVDTCRKYGGPWGTGVALMFRTHVAVDQHGGMSGVDDDLVELRELSRRVGDRWMRAQVCSAAGEAAMARGRYEEAQSEYEEALHLAYEVGAYAEAPFLIARLGEIAYRSGDTPLAERALAEADAEAERYGAVDARAFVRAMSATIAFDLGDIARARRECEAARRHGERATPPPQFEAAIANLDGRITAAESSPREGLPLIAEGLRRAVPARCAELVLATLTESLAVLLHALDDPARAARLLSAATTWRADQPRSAPERAQADDLEAGLRTTLGEQRYETERTAGAGLTPEGVLREVAAAEGELGLARP